ncbi:twin-arginine translocase TatA/TatE family subunit [Candidatus Sumerlaeota bacterium]|nr:twin-arginine translocase TatA/TatE family subunit [Candidatus Sumerlaeota bacterium]
MPGHWEIIVIILIALLIFGPKKIPELMRGLGKGIREFKDSMKEEPTKHEEPRKFKTTNHDDDNNHQDSGD